MRIIVVVGSKNNIETGYAGVGKNNDMDMKHQSKYLKNE